MFRRDHRYSGATFDQKMWIEENNISFGYLIQPSEVMEKLQAVTADVIQSLAKEIFAVDRASVAMVTPNEAGPQEEAILRSLKLSA